MDREQLIRERAYQLWQQTGMPEGQEAEHWRQAEAEIDGLSQSDEPQATPEDEQGGEMNAAGTGRRKASTTAMH